MRSSAFLGRSAGRSFATKRWSSSFASTCSLRTNGFLPSVWTRQAYEVSASIELNREHLVLFRWTDPGQTPEQLALRIRRVHRFTIDYAYALGR